MTATRRTLLAMAGALAAQGVAGARALSAGGPIKAVAFDAFTIFDPRSVTAAVAESFPGKGNELSAMWRVRQFEYCWLRTLNRTYVDFWQITEEALVFACRAAKLDLTAAARSRLMNAHLQLEPWPDSLAALTAMRKAGLRLVYLANFTANMLHVNSAHAGVADLFEHMLTTDAVKVFKPDPRAYQMAEAALQLPRDAIVFAAFGGWDAAGAKSFGLPTFWVNRLDAPDEELGVRPDATGATLTELADYVMTKEGGRPR